MTDKSITKIAVGVEHVDVRPMYAYMEKLADVREALQSNLETSIPCGAADTREDTPFDILLVKHGDTFVRVDSFDLPVHGPARFTLRAPPEFQIDSEATFDAPEWLLGNSEQAEAERLYEEHRARENADNVLRRLVAWPELSERLQQEWIDGVRNASK